MARGVEIEWASKDQAVLKTFQSVQNALDNVSRRMEKVESTSKRTGEATKGAFDKGVDSAKRFAVEMVGVGSATAGVLTVANALKTEYETLLRKERERAQAQGGAAEARRNARMAFQPDRTLGAGGFDAALDRIRQKTGASDATVSGVAGEAFSAKGALDNAAALSAIETALRVSPKDAGSATTLASRYLDLMGTGGIKDARVAAGLISQLQANSRVKNTNLVGSNLVPGITSLVSGGDSMESATELVATLNNLMVDDTGAVTRTALINLSSKLKEANIPGGNTAARIAALQRDPALREEFLSKATFEAEARAPIRAWLSGDPRSMATQRAAEAGIGAVGPGMVPAFEKQLAFINAGPLQPVADADLRGGANVETRNLADRRAGLRGQIRKEFERTLTETHGGAVLEGLADSLTLKDYDARVFGPSGMNPGRAAVSDVERLAASPALSNADRELARQQLAVLRELSSKFDRLGPEPAVNQNAVQGFSR